MPNFSFGRHALVPLKGICLVFSKTLLFIISSHCPACGCVELGRWSLPCKMGLISKESEEKSPYSGTKLKGVWGWLIPRTLLGPPFSNLKKIEFITGLLCYFLSFLELFTPIFKAN